MKITFCRKLIGIAFIMFFLVQVKSHSQYAIMFSDADSLVREGSDRIYNCQFDQAHSLFQKVIQIYPYHPAGYFLDAMVEWWKMTVQYNNKKNPEFERRIEKVITLCDKVLDTNRLDLNALFFKAGALGYRGRYYVNDKSWFSAASDAKEAFNILLQILEKAPGNHDAMLGTGTYNYFAQKFPEEYPLLQPIMTFLPRGDKQMGLLQLHASATYARYAATEAKVLLQQIYYQFEKDYSKALQISEELFKKYPDNPYFHRYYGRCLVVMGDFDKMEQTWRDALMNYINKKPYYDKFTAREALYYIGYALMKKRQFDMALKYFYKCDEASRLLDQDPSGFMVRLNLNVGNIYDLQGKRNLAVSQYKKILKFKEYDNSHTEAEYYLKKPYGR